MGAEANSWQAGLGSSAVISRRDFAGRIDTLACGVRALQQQRDNQRRAAKLKGAEILELLRQQKLELESLKQRLVQGGAAIFSHFQEDAHALVELARAQGEKALADASAHSFSVFLCARKHTAKELNNCCRAAERVRLGSKGVKVRAAAKRTPLKRVKLATGGSPEP